jgi:hypothetical protein
LDPSYFTRLIKGHTSNPSLVRLEGSIRYPCPATEVAKASESKVVTSCIFVDGRCIDLDRKQQSQVIDGGFWIKILGDVLRLLYSSQIAVVQQDKRGT